MTEEFHVELADALVGCTTVSDALSDRALQLANIRLVLVVRPPQPFLLFRIVLFEIFQLMLAEEFFTRDNGMVLHFFMRWLGLGLRLRLRLGWLLRLLKPHLLKFFHSPLLGDLTFESSFFFFAFLFHLCC